MLSQQRIKRFIIFFLGTLIVMGLTVAGYAFTTLFLSNTLTTESPIGLADCGSPKGGEKDNAIATFYGNSGRGFLAPTWVNKIQWNCVYNIKDFSGSNLVEQFNAARDAAFKHGGGIVYFPSGTYVFNDSIKLRSGVVIRGETPAVKSAKASNYNPSSKLVFPKYEPQLSGDGTPNETAFKSIQTLTPDQDSNIGIINLEINRAAINIVGNIDTHKNSNIIIFGVRSNNVAKPDPQVPKLEFQNPWQRYSHRFASNIELTGYENILVANNRINDNITDNYEQPGYKLQSKDKKTILTYQEGSKVPFNYSNHYGIVVNRGGKQGGFKLAGTPTTEPGLFRKGIVIRDNWVYHTMRVGIHAAGDGLIIQNNDIQDQPNKKWWTDPTGTREATGAVTLENRGIDFSGWNVLVEGNNYQVYRHQIGDTKYLSVDGEGMLMQECCGGTTVKNVMIKNNQGNAYIGLYKVQEINHTTIENNQVLNSDIFVMADTNNQPYGMNQVKIINNQVSGNILVKASLGGQGNEISGNRGNQSGKLEYSCSIEVNNNSGFNTQPCFPLR
ncbi:conserved exported hypothetical protein [Planktothrix sp. PCC 11201]|uniref:glycosyl hydrolase family 28-related protein n=1 Tax=Planktothrix sp. PCC 11201 TaxID=1729650 RepID=UPI000921BF5E|nr:glycosyl hydrolase family 28-related protein [Planktothrix sp. PCC 11201]SKB12928.1 conserved exported hypothetical protein [Planktothrix sp. PCC 11201]